MENKLNFSAGDILLMKKPHACESASKEFEVLRLGSDIRIKCTGCGHEVIVPRVKLEKSVKKIFPKN